MSKIEQIISDIEDYIDSCKLAPFSGNKILVSKEEMEEFLRELRLRTPDEIKKYQKIISNKDAILADAKEQAEAMVNAAKLHTQELIDEHEIMQRAYEEAEQVRNDAYAQAQQIVDNAQLRANQMELNAIDYTDQILANLQMIIEHSIESNRSKYDSLMSALDKQLNVVMTNRGELADIKNGSTEQGQDNDSAEDYDDGFSEDEQ